MNQLPLCATLLLTAVISSFAAPADTTVRKSFTVAEGGTLSIESNRGSINVTSTDADTVEVEVLRTAKKGSDSEIEKLLGNHKLSIAQSGNDVTVHSDFPQQKFSILGSSPQVHLTFNVKVPKKYNLNLETAGGSISVPEIQGEVVSQTSGGNLSFGKITGSILGETSGGSISIQSCNGKVIAETSGGSIKIGEVQGDVTSETSGGSISMSKVQGNVVAETSGGGIQIDGVTGSVVASTSGGSIKAKFLEQPPADCTLETSGGSIEVRLIESAKMTINAETSGGKIHTDFPVGQKLQDHRELHSEINGGGPALNLETSGGNIHISKL
ncbi:MAG: DUF4097 family beta strand repeat-containing protein [Verrucomicrobiota bacterium]|nr:DUF4097 family beta strand repeat-containing protein [Verrucomicrobiota bacterium]